MTPSERTKIIITIIAAIVLLSSGLFIGRCTKSAPQSQYEEVLKRDDMLKEKENEKVALYERIIESKDKQLENLNERDSILDMHYKEKELTYNKLNETIHNIPIRINRISNNGDSIRAAFRQF